LLLAHVFTFNVLSDEEIRILIPSILGKTEDKNIRVNTMNILSLMSSHQTVKECLRESEYDLGIFNMLNKLIATREKANLTCFTKKDLHRSLVNILLNLSNDSEEANMLAQNPLLKNIVQAALETLDIGLLKIVNNITFFCSATLFENIVNQEGKKERAPLRKLFKKTLEFIREKIIELHT
jgi:hypothetical protein